ncbi:MAG TPA: molybdopterin-dependent oxidoreductase [Aeromicrobium sp.]|nr:molybdopterin-dependent oxidoreductase [Aeromicrobium sp.]
MGTQLAVCNLCEAICGLELTIEDGAVTGVRGNKEDPLSRGYICPKGVAIADIYSDPDRLRRPIRRVGSGPDATWEEISWDEALDMVADGLASAINERGKDAVGIYLGNPNAHSLGSLTHGIAMIQSFRTRNKFSATSVDQLPHQLMSYLLYGHQLLLPVPDIDRTQYFMVFGGNPMASNGSLMTVPDFPNRLRDLKDRGGKMIVFDPRRTETAKVASEHVFVRPSTDAWVLLAMLNTLFVEGLTNPLDYVDGLDEVAKLVAPYTPERAESASGVPAETILRVTREFAAADGAVAYGRMGVSTAEFGTVCQWAIQMLNIVTGNLDHVGGAMLTSPAIDIITMGLVGRGHIDRFRSRVRDIPEFGGELPVSVMREEIETPGDGQIRAMLTLAGNPVLSTPDGAALDRALDSLDFMASVDIYLNETTRHANVILPPTSALEREQYDLVFHVLSVRNTARFTPAIFPKGREDRHDWEIFREIVRRTTKRLEAKPPLAKRLTTSLRLRMSPSRMIGLLLRKGGKTTLKELRANPAGIDLGPLEAGQFPRRLGTKNKRIDAMPDFVVADLSRLEAQELPTGDELMLIGRRHKQNCNSWMHNSERLTKGQPRHQLLINPADLATRGLLDGAMVKVSSRVGTVLVEAKATDDMMPGVVSLPHGYGHQKEGIRLAQASQVDGVSINDLTDPERLDVSGNAAFSGVPVRIA